MDGKRNDKEDSKVRTKLSDDDMEKVSGGIFFANNTIYRQGIDDSRAGFAVMSGETTANPVYLEDIPTGTPERNKRHRKNATIPADTGNKTGWA